MSHLRLSLLALASLALALPGDAATPQQGEPLRIAAAISLQEPLQEIAAAFEKESGAAVTLSFASSGQIMNQIKGGAPIDVFISAAHQQVNDLEKEKLVDAASKRVIATNTLVLIVPAAAKDAPSGFEDLANPKVRRLAIGEPRTVPAGQYALQVLEHLKLSESLHERLIYGTNVRQVLAYVERGEVSAGIVYRTDAMASGDKVRVIATAKADWHEPIEYPAAVVTSSKQKDAAGKFLDFLKSEAALKILETRGFGAAKE